MWESKVQLENKIITNSFCRRLISSNSISLLVTEFKFESESILTLSSASLPHSHHAVMQNLDWDLCTCKELFVIEPSS